MYIRNLLARTSWPANHLPVAGAALVMSSALALGSRPSLWPIALSVLIAPLLEEIVFRRGLQDALIRSPWLASHARGFGDHAHAAASVGLTAMAFAAAHLVAAPGWLSAFTLFPALLVGVLYQRQRRLWPCVLTHALCNLTWLVVLRDALHRA